MKRKRCSSCALDISWRNGVISSSSKDAREIDVFRGVLDGLIIAELELDDAEQQFHKPDWLGEEVTHDRRYYNASLAMDGLPQQSGFE